MNAEYLTMPGFPARHGFFTRQGGVSIPPYASLNCRAGGGDDPAHVRENRARVAEAVGVPRQALLGLKQVHSATVVTVTDPWPEGAGPEADAMVTNRQGLALGIITADCAPVLFVDREAGVIGAAHAGWTGAVAGVLEAAVAAMRELGACPGRIRAAIGPCIQQASYEVGADMRARVLAGNDGLGESFFAPDARPDHWQFDLPGYCHARLRGAGVEAAALSVDTVPDEARFFSHRRRVLAGGGEIGHQISVIVQ
jgi:polyphenol oxidase